MNSLGENSSSVHNQKRIEETSTNDTVEGESSPDAAVSRVNSDELKPTALPDVTLDAIANKQSTVDEAPNSQPQKNIITNEQKITNVGEPIQNLHNEEIKDEMVSALESRKILLKTHHLLPKWSHKGIILQHLHHQTPLALKILY